MRGPGTFLPDKRFAEINQTKARKPDMLYTIVVILIVLWLIGLLAHVGGGLIHLLLLVAGIVFVFQLMTGRRSL